MSRKNRKGSHPSPSVKRSDDYEKVFPQVLESLTDKCGKERNGALQSLCDVLVHHYVPSLVQDNAVALRNCIENSIRRGKATEQLLGAKLATLLALQLGPLEESIFKSLNQLLLSTMKDESVQIEVRTKFCTALGLLNFLGCDDGKHIRVMMQSLKDIIEMHSSHSDKSGNRKSSDGNIIAEVLSAWALLFTSMSTDERISSRITLAFVRKLLSLLESPHLEVRVAVGETLCVIWESGRCENADYLDRFLDDFTNAVQKLATDSNKFRGKRDLKFQRATFRDVLLFLEGNISPEINIRFGSESLVLDSWIRYTQYSALCSLVGPGMTNHLQANNFVRELFQLDSQLRKRAEAKNQTSKSGMLKQQTPTSARNLSKYSSTDKAIFQGKGKEQLWDAKLSAFLELLVDNNQTKKLRAIFCNELYEWRNTKVVRAKCCIAVGLLSLSANRDEVQEMMINLFETFHRCCFLGYHQDTEIELLYSATLFTWGLLVTLLPPEYFVSWAITIQRKMPKLWGNIFVRMLKCSYLEVRLTAAETVALVLQWGRLHDSNFLSEYVDDFIVAIRQLNEDLQDPGNSIHPNSIRKFHRATCHDVLKYLEMNISPEIKVPVGDEFIVLDSWALYFRYSVKCVEIGPQMALFLQEKALIPKTFLQQVTSSLQAVKQTKLESNLLNTSSSKQRSLNRSENRDKRLNAFD